MHLIKRLGPLLKEVEFEDGSRVRKVVLLQVVIQPCARRPGSRGKRARRVLWAARRGGKERSVCSAAILELITGRAGYARAMTRA